MNTTAQNTKNTSSKAAIVLFVLFLMSSASMLGQNKSASTTTTTIEISIAPVQQVALDSDVDFMNWFMSSKQTQSFGNGSEVSNSSTPVSRKKQIISSGIVPNKVLYRTLIKKVISQENAIV